MILIREALSQTPAYTVGPELDTRITTQLLKVTK